MTLQTTLTPNQQTTSTAHAHEVVELNKDNFDETISSHAVVLVDFWAPWCGPCRSFAPTYAAIAKKHPDILFAKVNVDQEQILAAKYQLRAIPTLMAFRDGDVVLSRAGALPASKLEEVIANTVGR